MLRDKNTYSFSNVGASFLLFHKRVQTSLVNEFLFSCIICASPFSVYIRAELFHWKGGEKWGIVRRFGFDPKITTRFDRFDAVTMYYLFFLKLKQLYFAIHIKMNERKKKKKNQQKSIFRMKS